MSTLPDPGFTQAGMTALTGTIRCANCGVTSATPEDNFCPRCGWHLDQPPPSAQALGERLPITEVTIALIVSAGESHVVRQTPYLIGRDQGDLRFPEDLQLSRLHAALIYRDHQLYVRDLESRNGSYLDDRRLPPNEDIPVMENEKLRVGNKTFTLRFKGDEGRLDDFGKAYYLDSSTLGRRFALRPGENIIGRGDHAHVRVEGNEAISRLHAKLKLEES
ncbi:MAG: FHA domain-containing protein, partial [bacterium]